MDYTARLSYPEIESNPLQRIGALMKTWHTHFNEGASKEIRAMIEDFVPDGFYPHYYAQKRKILFIGREARGIGGDNYLDILCHEYQTGKKIGNRHLNQSLFHRRILYTAFGLLNGHPPYDEVPYADKIGDTFATDRGISFAFMNISKISNERDDSERAHWPTLLKAVEDSSLPRNFICEEISVLTPDIIIAMNLQGECLNSLGERTKLDSNSGVEAYDLCSNGHPSLLLNAWHFSATRKGDIKDYYDPICLLADKYCKV